MPPLPERTVIRAVSTKGAATAATSFSDQLKFQRVGTRSKEKPQTIIRLRLPVSKLLSDLHLHNGNLLAILAQTLKLHLAGLEREQSIVAALPNVDAGMDVGAALADQDVAGQCPSQR